MRRWHAEEALMRRRASAAAVELSYPPMDGLGRYRKRHPGDCGRAHCALCHGKLYAGADRARDRREAFRLEDLAA